MLTINQKCEMWTEGSKYVQDYGDEVEKILLEIPHYATLMKLKMVPFNLTHLSS